MTDVADYIDLPEPARAQERAAARDHAVRGAEDYAGLLAAEAGIAARDVFPTVGHLTFRLTDDAAGPSAVLVAAYDEDGWRLWHIDRDGEWPDESLVTDHLTAAARWCPDYFTDAPDGDGLLLFTVDS
jgi:hypothetical protein